MASYIDMLDTSGVRVALSPVAPNHGLKLGRFDLSPRIACNEQQSTMQKDFPQRFVGVVGIDPGEGVPESLVTLEYCVKNLGLRVATIEPGRQTFLAPNPADKRLYDIYSLAQALEIPIIIQTSGLKGGCSIDYAHPRWIDQIAHDFPKLGIICAHACTPYARELSCVIRRRSNVFASPDCYTFQDFSVWNSLATDVPNQLIFASGFPFCGNLEAFVMRYIAAPWNVKFIDNIMYKNAIRALRLEDTPYFSSMLEQPEILGPSARYRTRLELLGHLGLTGKFRRMADLSKFWLRN